MVRPPRLRVSLRLDARYGPRAAGVLRVGPGGAAAGLRELGSIEITVVNAAGGRGSAWIDDLVLESSRRRRPLPSEKDWHSAPEAGIGRARSRPRRPPGARRSGPPLGRRRFRDAVRHRALPGRADVVASALGLLAARGARPHLPARRGGRLHTGSSPGKRPGPWLRSPGDLGPAARVRRDTDEVPRDAGPRIPGRARAPVVRRGADLLDRGGRGRRRPGEWASVGGRISGSGAGAFSLEPFLRTGDRSWAGGKPRPRTGSKPTSCRSLGAAPLPRGIG